MITKLVEKDLLYVLCYMNGSARKTRVLPAMIPKLVEKDLLYVLCYMRGSARKRRVLPAMIPRLVAKDLLYVLCYMRGFCQKDKGSAETDSGFYNGGSARLNKGLLAMIPKSVK